MARMEVDLNLKTLGQLFDVLPSCLAKIVKTHHGLLSFQNFT